MSKNKIDCANKAAYKIGRFLLDFILNNFTVCKKISNTEQGLTILEVKNRLLSIDQKS